MQRTITNVYIKEHVRATFWLYQSSEGSGRHTSVIDTHYERSIMATSTIRRFSRAAAALAVSGKLFEQLQQGDRFADREGFRRH